MLKWRNFWGISLSVAMLVTSIQPIQMGSVLAEGNMSEEEMEQTVSENGTEQNLISANGEVPLDNQLTALTDEGTSWSQTKVKLNEKKILNVNVSAVDMEGITYQWFCGGESIEGASGQSIQTKEIDRNITYGCHVRDQYGNMQIVNYSISVDNQLAATPENGGFLTVGMNESATLTVNVTAEDMSGITYEWRQQDVDTNVWSDVIDGATGATYETGNIQEKSIYFCRVTDKYGNSQYAYFNISVDNKLVVYPEGGSVGSTQTVKAAPGERVTMKPVVEALDKSNITYKWWKGNSVELATSENFEVDATVENNRMYYYCTVTDRYGSSQTATFQIYIDNNLSITADSSYITVGLNETATLKVNVSALDATGITYSWAKYEREGNTATPVVIPNAVSDSYETGEYGSYICYVQDNYGNMQFAQFTVGFDNQLQPASQNYNKNIQVKLGESVTLKAEVTANDMSDLKYEWYEIVKKPTPGGGYVGESVKMDGQISSECVIDHVNCNQAYQCYVTDRYSNRIMLHFGVSVDNGFHVYGLNETGHKSSGYVKYLQDYNQKATLKVIAEAEDVTDITYVWRKKDPVNQCFELDESVTGDTYVTDEVTAAQEYTCDVTDRFGNSLTFNFYVNVDNGLKVKPVGNRDVSVAYNTPAKLQVIVQAKDKEGLIYRWFTSEGKTYSKYTDTFETPNVKKAGYAVCNVTDKYGNTERYTFNLKVQNNLQVNPISATEFTVAPGEKVTLEALASADDEQSLICYWVEDPDVTSNVYTVTAGDQYAKYRYKAKDSYGNAKTLTFHVYIANNFKAEAKDGAVKKVRQGENVELAIIATADDTTGITYQWNKTVYISSEDRYMDSILTEEQESNTYTVTKEDLGNSVSEEFYCIVRDKYNNPVKVVFTVNVVTDAITTAADQEITSENVDAVLDDLKDKSSEQLVAELQTTEAVEALDTIEETYKETHAIEEKAPESTVDEIAADKIAVTGAALNVEPETTITLRVDKTEEVPEIEETVFKVKNMIVFDMSVVAKKADGSDADVDFSKELAIPVTVTLPIPEGINLNTVKIFHQQSDGSMQEVKATIDKTNRTATFTVTHFSLFAFVDELLAQLGDINGDGEVNAKDRMYLARALAGWDGYTVPDVDLADFNGDGEVNAKDRMYLARKLAGWAGYE